MADYDEFVEETEKKPKLGPTEHLVVFVGSACAISLLLVIVWLICSFNQVIWPDQYTSYYWIGRKTEVAYFGAVYFLKVFAWESYFPTYLSAFLLQPYVRYGFWALLIMAGSFTCYITTYPTFMNYKKDEDPIGVLTACTIVAITVFIAAVINPILIPNYNMFDRNRVLRHINWWCWVLFSVSLIYQWYLLHHISRTFPTNTLATVPLYDDGIKCYIVLFIVQFLEYCRVHRINKEIVYIDLAFMDMILWYTSIIFVFCVVVQYYAGCGLCPQIKEMHFGALSHRKCWWAGKKALHIENDINANLERTGGMFSNESDAQRPLYEQRHFWLKDILDFYIPEEYRREDPQVYNYPVLSTEFKEFTERYFPGVGGAPPQKYDRGHQASRSLVLISWSPCITKQGWKELKPRCIGVLITRGFILTTAQCFESRWDRFAPTDTTKQPAEIVLKYYARILRVPVQSNTLYFPSVRQPDAIDFKEGWTENNLAIIRLPPTQLPGSKGKPGEVIKNAILEDNIYYPPPYGGPNIIPPSLEFQNFNMAKLRNLESFTTDDIVWLNLKINPGTVRNEETYLMYREDQDGFQCHNGVFLQNGDCTPLAKKSMGYPNHGFFQYRDEFARSGLFCVCTGMKSYNGILYRSTADMLTGTPIMRRTYNFKSKTYNMKILGLMLKTQFFDYEPEVTLFTKIDNHHEWIRKIIPKEQWKTYENS